MQPDDARLAVATREPRSHIEVHGVPLAVHDGAPGSSLPVVVCLHAIGHGGGDFASFEAAFGASHRVITVDWPGQGASGDDAEPASAARYLTLFAALADRLGLARFVILGNSIGGAVALAYAAAHPARVRGLIVSNPGGLDPGGVFARLFIRNLERHFRHGVARAPGFQGWFARYYARILITPEARAERDAIVASGYAIAPRLLEAWASFRQPEADLRPLLPRVTAPVLVAWAKRDTLVSWSRNRAAVEAIPDRRVAFFEAGHSPFLETPAAFNDAARTFLASLS
jgi:4,5:9,10-diseco-3-hydroxy-5,9,17-trioxoandrosta-1(10),2-diene-4-oate hydrolase